VAPGPDARNPTRRRGRYFRIEDLQRFITAGSVLGERRFPPAEDPLDV